jgi:hypothetical protein
MPLFVPKKAKSTPNLAVRPSSSGSPDQERGDRKATGPSLFSGGEPERPSCTGSQRVGALTSMTLKKEQFREAAKHVLALTERQLAEMLKRGDFIEVKSE